MKTANNLSLLSLKFYSKIVIFTLVLLISAGYKAFSQDNSETSLLSQNTQSKHPVEVLFEKYAEKDGFTVVNITSDMFNMFRSMSEESDSREEYAEAISGINSLKILSYNSDENSKLKASEFYNEMIKSLPIKSYKELMTVKDKGSDVRFLYKGDDKKVTELLMIVGEENEGTLIWINGIIDLKSISKLQKLGFKGMKDLDKLKMKPDKAKKQKDDDKEQKSKKGD